MARLRCLPTLPNVPGTLYLVTLQLHENSAPIQKICMDRALDKWLRLFVLRVIHYSLEGCGVSMLIYVPGKRLSAEEATARNCIFDQWLIDKWQTERDSVKGKLTKGRSKPRTHNFTSQQLASLSDFMKLFKPDLRALHRFQPRPEDLLPGFSRIPVYRRRFSAVVVQHTALPPVFSLPELETIRKQLSELGFEGEAETRRPTELHISQHGIGTMEFLAELEEQCCLLLQKRGREPKLWQRFGIKYITPITQGAVNKRLGILSLREEYEDYPKMCSLLACLDGITDKLMEPNNILISAPMSRARKQDLVTICLPVSLTLLLTDGLLRWYYKTTKDVEFPHYNYYRRLRPWETLNGLRH